MAPFEPLRFMLVVLTLYGLPSGIAACGIGLSFEKGMGRASHSANVDNKYHGSAVDIPER
jgi:hypothetical protein